MLVNDISLVSSSQVLTWTKRVEAQRFERAVLEGFKRKQFYVLLLLTENIYTQTKCRQYQQKMELQ